STDAQSTDPSQTVCRPAHRPVVGTHGSRRAHASRTSPPRSAGPAAACRPGRLVELLPASARRGGILDLTDPPAGLAVLPRRGGVLACLRGAHAAVVGPPSGHD